MLQEGINLNEHKTHNNLGWVKILAFKIHLNQSHKIKQ